MKKQSKLGSAERLFKLANELYYRTKGKTFVNGSKAMYGETNAEGRRITLVELYGITKTIGITSFVELGKIEIQSGKKYTSSANVRWIGAAPTEQIAADLKQWNRNYNKKRNEEKELEALIKAEALLAEQAIVDAAVAKAEVPAETIDKSPTQVSSKEIYEMLVEKSVDEKPVNPISSLPTDKQSVLQMYNAIQIQRNEIEAQRNRILASMLTELKKLNEAKIILGTEYSARG